MSSNLDKYIENHLKDPFYLSSMETKNGGYVSLKNQEAMLFSIFNDIHLKKEINLRLPLLIELKFPNNLFFKNYQLKFEDIDNEVINTIAFKSFIDYKKREEQNPNLKNSLNLYKDFGLYLERDVFYNQLVSKNLPVAFTYKRFIDKVKKSLFDTNAYPFPYSLENKKNIGFFIAKELNFSLLKNIKSIFKYSNIECRNIILDAFVGDIKVVFSDNKNDISYKSRLAELFYDMHPNSYNYLMDKHKIEIPRSHKINYLYHNAKKLNPEQFVFFSSAFKSIYLDEDIISDFAIQKYNSENKFNENFEKNITFFINASIEQSEQFIEEQAKKSPFVFR